MLDKVRNAFISDEKIHAEKIKKVVSLFSNATQWLDLITALSTLKMHIEIYNDDKKGEKVKFSNFFESSIQNVAMCLNLCLRPEMPSGIHLKALEIYILFLQKMNEEQKLTYFHQMAIGFFPVMKFASELVLEKFFCFLCFVFLIALKLNEIFVN